MAVGQAPKDGDAKPVELDIQALEYQPSEVVYMPSQPGTRGILPPGWKTMVKMVIHQSNKEQFKIRIAKLDTGSWFDVLSESVANDLGMKWETYDGADLAPLGPNIKPLGQLTLDWHVIGKLKTYTTTFVILDNHTTRGFDALLSDDTIGKIGFFVVNPEVFYAGKAKQEAHNNRAPMLETRAAN